MSSWRRDIELARAAEALGRTKSKAAALRTFADEEDAVNRIDAALRAHLEA